MPISASGLGSGLDINSIITQLMTLERRSVTLIDVKEAGLQGKISALGSLKSAIASLQTAAGALKPSSTQTAPEKFAAFKASVADVTVASATAAGTAAASTYSIEVLSLAKEHRLVSAADPAIEAGARTITIERGTVSGGTFSANAAYAPISVELDGNDNTLEGIRDAINAKKAGVKAAVVAAADGDRLTLSAGASGDQSVLRVSGGVSALNYDPTAALAYDENAPPAVMSELQAAGNAAVKFNGITVESIANTFSEVAPGVALTALKESATTLTVSQDFTGIKSQLDALVKGYNEANKAFGDLGGFKADTQTAGPLNGDSALRSSQAALRAVINTVPTALSGASLQRLSEIGIAVQTDGSLKVDATKLDAALKADFDAVANVAAAYGTAFAARTEELLGENGVVTSRSEGLALSVKTLGKQRDALELRLTQIEVRYRKQFTALDSVIASMNQTSSFLQQQLANLPSISSRSNR